MKNSPPRAFIQLVVIFLVFAALATLASNGFSRSSDSSNFEARGFHHTGRSARHGAIACSTAVRPSQDADFKVELSQVARGSSDQFTITSNDCSAKTLDVANTVIDDLQGLKDQHGLDLLNTGA